MCVVLLKDYPDALSVKDLCEFFDSCDKSIRKMLNTKQIQSIRVGRKFMVPKIYIIDYLIGSHIDWK